MEAMLEIVDVVTAYGKIECAEGRLAQRKPGPHHLPSRAERCRQDDADDDGRRSPEAAPGLDQT